MACESDPTWWTKLIAFFGFGSTERLTKFLAGEMVVLEGIAFYVDPNEPKLLYAASPSSEVTQQRLNLVVSEAVRMLPYFLAEHPDFTDSLRDRTLAVRLISGYCTSNLEVLAQHQLEWDILSDFSEDAEFAG